ncbi:MAG: phosphomannose isomerase type II C-terminal cupin domain [Syntrophales bacterium]|nr:phosphomannose isomerase type II C-terminal cupin domain [Syntrophales bacterium]
MEEQNRPWGFYLVLSHEEDHKVKRIVVRPGERTSLQAHRRRREHWHIISGEAIINLGDDLKTLNAGQSIDIPMNVPHRLENGGSRDLVLIEIQTGDYFGEDDIRRMEDDYGRS